MSAYAPESVKVVSVYDDDETVENTHRGAGKQMDDHMNPMHGLDTSILSSEKRPM